VALNTRVNALGGGASLSPRNRLIAQKAATKFVPGSQVLDQIDSCLLGKRSRSIDMTYSTDDECDEMDEVVHRSKRIRAASFPLSPDPIRGCLKMQEYSPAILQTPLICQQLLTHMTVEYLGNNEGRRRVKFQEEDEHFYPPSVTPDQIPGSFDED
jgi:hypothetical protein